MECDKSYDKKLNKDLIKRSENTQRLFDGDANEFFPMLQKYLSIQIYLQLENIQHKFPKIHNIKDFI